MKKITMFLAALSIAAGAHAWEFANNPDRFPSVGANVQQSNLSGQRSEVDLPSMNANRAQGGQETSSLRSVGIDTRLPLNDSLTLSVNYNHLEADSDYLRDPSAFRESKTLTGYSYGFTLRLYFNH